MTQLKVHGCFELNYIYSNLECELGVIIILITIITGIASLRECMKITAVIKLELQGRRRPGKLLESWLNLKGM